MAAADPSLSFPTDIGAFGADDRISYSLRSKTYLAVADDGSEYEFNEGDKTWAPVDYDQEDDDDLHSLHEAGDHSSALALDSQSRKRGPDPSYDDENPNQTRPQRPTKKAKAPPAPRQNTAVYVTGLPLDATVDEVYDLFSKKGGVIAEEIDSGKPRIKMYSDENGSFKGDALVVFFKPQSVEMAIMLLDDTDFRYTSSGLSDGRIRVQPADSSYKKTNYDADGNKSKGAEGQKPQKNDRDRQKIIRKTQKLDAKLADWDDDVPYADQEVATRTSKMVILKHMFTLAELEEDPAAILEIKEDIREECEKLGEVTNVVLYDLEPEGYVSIKFKSHEAAEGCVELMDGRSFAGRVVEARLSFGKERFKQSSKKEDDSDH